MSTNKLKHLRFFSTLKLIFTISISFVICGHASAVTIEGTELPSLTQVSNQFATSHGALFSSNMPFVTFATDGGRLGIYGTDPGGNPSFSYLTFNAPITVTFVSPTDGTTPGVVNGAISAVWGDGGGDTDFMRLRAFDIGGNILGTVFDSGTTWQNIGFTGNGIHQLIFDQQPGAPFSSDTFLDSLTFNLPTAVVPIPAAIWLFGSGLIGLIGVSRRK